MCKPRAGRFTPTSVALIYFKEVNNQKSSSTIFRKKSLNIYSRFYFCVKLKV